MRATVLDAFGGEVRLTGDVPTPKPGPGEVLIGVAACGVGLTLERARTGDLGGSAPRIVGHELAGTVLEAGSGAAPWAPGDRVTASFYLTCGSCPRCADGQETLCENWAGFVGVHADGGLADAVVLPARSLVRVPDDVGLAEAAIAADAIATPYRALTGRVRIRPGQTVAVIGAGGGVGVHMVAMARALGARVVGIERDETKLKQLPAHGCDLTFNPGDDPDWAPRLASELGIKADVCVDMVATRSTLVNGVGVLNRSGTLLVVGYQGGVTFELDPRPFVLDEVVVTGSRYATRADIAAALDLVAQGRVTPVIGARYPLPEVADAYRAMQANQAFGRIVVDIDG
jgi:D-arabinose 1-dehydrogenase-like Zn-dependent alcohol dehydrogenase